MTYRQTLRITATGMIRWPMTADEVQEACDALGDLWWAMWPCLARILVFVTFPVSVPLMALLMVLLERDNS